MFYLFAMKYGRVRRSLLPLSICLLLLLSGCHSPAAKGPADTFGLDFSLPAGSHDGGIILFIADGLNAATFQELLGAGQLPSIDRYFVKRGLYVPRAVASHPSLTMDNLLSIVSGRFPGHHGLPAAKSFDRNQIIFRNYETLQDKNKLDDDAPVESLYQQFPGRLTFSLFLQPHRGATHFYENRLSAGPAVAFAQHGLVDRLALVRFREAMAVARQYGQFPAVMTVYQLSVNFTAYDYGATSPQYRQAMHEMDRQIGRVLADLERSGMLDKCVIALVSDHGHCDTPRHGRIHDYVESLGIPLAGADPAGEDVSFEQRLSRFGRVAAVPYGSGDRYWVLYLRKPLPDAGRGALAPWLERPSPGTCAAIRRRRGRRTCRCCWPNCPTWTLWRIWRVPAASAWCGEAGKWSSADSDAARASQPQSNHDEGIIYRLVRGTDPLEWAGKAPDRALTGEPLTSRQWLEATAGTEFPDLATGLLSYFDGRLAADIVVFPSPQWDFDGWRRAGHGGIRAAEMFAPMLVAGPGIPIGPDSRGPHGGPDADAAGGDGQTHTRGPGWGIVDRQDTPVAGFRYPMAIGLAV